MSRAISGLEGIVSVVIPTYNAGIYIQEAVQSVWKQTALPREIIVVDDCSTDGTPERVADLATRSRVPLRLVRCATNSGAPAKPMNIGVGQSQGELVAVLDQDDIWASTKLEHQAAVLMRMPQVSFVASLFGYCGTTTSRGRTAKKWSKVLTRSMVKSGEYHFCSGRTGFDLLVRHENYVGGFPGFMFRRRDWQLRGGFDESLRVAADYDFLCWLCSRGDTAFIPEIHYWRREHGDNITFSEVPRLTDVVRVLTRYISPEQLAARREYRHVLASKVLRMAQFFAYCDNARQAEQLLQLFYSIRRNPIDVLLRPLRRAQISAIRSLGDVLHLTHLRRVSAAEASAAVHAVQRIIGNHGLEDHLIVPVPSRRAA